MYYVLTREVKGVKLYYIRGNEWGNEWLAKKYSFSRVSEISERWLAFRHASIEPARDLNAVIESFELRIKGERNAAEYWYQQYCIMEGKRTELEKEVEALKEKLERYEGVDFMYTKASKSNGYLSKKITELERNNAELTEMGANLCTENSELHAKLDGIFSIISGKKIGIDAGEPCNRYGCHGKIMSYSINGAFHCGTCGAYQNVKSIGAKEGEVCNRNGCDGVITNGPIWAYCPKCGSEDNDPREIYFCPECKAGDTSKCNTTECYNCVPF